MIFYCLNRYCGEDAFFIARNEKAHVLGVADGVGGWSLVGVDPSHFSWTLMENCKAIVENSLCTSSYEILSRAYEEILAKKQVSAGSSTACVLSLTRENNKAILQSASIGDSSYIVMRDAQILYRSEEQQHYFNAPYQLAVIPPAMQHESLADLPSSALRHEMEVKHGDIVVLATDGLFDNLFDKDIVEIVNKDKSNGVDKIAKELLYEARKRSFYKFYDSPFCMHARKHGVYFVGGKEDDTTIIVAKVIFNENIHHD